MPTISSQRIPLACPVVPSNRAMSQVSMMSPVVGKAQLNIADKDGEALPCLQTCSDIPALISRHLKGRVSTIPQSERRQSGLPPGESVEEQTKGEIEHVETTACRCIDRKTVYRPGRGHVVAPNVRAVLGEQDCASFAESEETAGGIGSHANDHERRQSVFAVVHSPTELLLEPESQIKDEEERAVSEHDVRDPQNPNASVPRVQLSHAKPKNLTLVLTLAPVL